LDGSSLIRRSGFRTRSLFVIILYFFINKFLSINASAILLLLIRLTVLIKVFKNRLYNKER